MRRVVENFLFFLLQREREKQSNNKTTIAFIDDNFMTRISALLFNYIISPLVYRRLKNRKLRFSQLLAICKH